MTLMSLCLEMEMSEINGKVALSNNFPFMVIIMILFYSSFKFFKNNKKKFDIKDFMIKISIFTPE